MVVCSGEASSSVASSRSPTVSESLRASSVVGLGRSDCSRLRPGFQFSVAEHPRATFNQAFVLTSVTHHGVQPHVLHREAAGSFRYHNELRCIPEGTCFRPPRVTPRPEIRGTQSAVVVGTSGEEIYTEPYGRVKVQFHWDREGKHDENSSCWIRVSQPWAGKAWGSVAIPRIGQEVVVSFLEGDPDRPIITGRVYNDDNMPPYELQIRKDEDHWHMVNFIRSLGEDELAALLG